MKYTDLKKTGKLIRTFDKYGEGPYRDAYAGSVEYWAVGNAVYIHDTCRNGMAYTGRSANTYLLASVDSVDAILSEIEDGCVANVAGEMEPLTSSSLRDIILAHVAPVPKDYQY